MRWFAIQWAVLSFLNTIGSKRELAYLGVGIVLGSGVTCIAVAFII